MQAIKLAALRRYMLEHELLFLGGQPATYHCHHFNLFLDQSIDDALGHKDSSRLKTEAAREFSYPLLSAACDKVGAETPAEKIQTASDLFRQMGHGRLELAADQRGGEAYGTHLHYGYAWSEKYGDRVRRRHPADAFAAGFMSAAAEVANGLPLGTLWADETACVAQKESRCSFTLSPDATPAAATIRVGEDETRANVGIAEDGIGEDVIQPIVAGLKEFLGGVAGNAQGLVPAFGVLATLQLTGYYNRISYDALEIVKAKAPQSVPVLEALLRESGHVCVFHTYGGVLLSPEWESLVGPLTDNPQDIILWSLAISRAFGFGRWTLAEFEKDKRLVLRTSSSYESAYHRARHGMTDHPVEYLLQGAAVATAQLAHRVPWTEKPQLDAQAYQDLFRGGMQWKAEQTRSLVRGDSASEIVVTRV